MRSNKLIALIIVWVLSIILLKAGITRPTYLVEKMMEVFNFEFSSKEAYALAVESVRWLRWFYLGALIFLTFYLFQRQRRWQ